MATDLLIDAWGDYRDAVIHYYREIAQPALDDDRELLPDREVAAADRALQHIVERSQLVTEIGEAQLRLSQGSSDYDLIALRLLAAGAVDVAVACEALRICPDPPAADPIFIVEGAHSPPQSALALLKEADQLFGDDDGAPRDSGSTPIAPTRPSASAAPLDFGDPETGETEAESGGSVSIAGGAIDLAHDELIAAARQSLTKLIDDAAEPGLKFATGLFSGIAGGFHATAMVEPLQRLHTLAERVGVIKRRLVRLLASGFQKLFKTGAAQPDQLVGRAVTISEGVARDKAEDFAEGRLVGPFGDMLRWLVRCEDAGQAAESVIAPAEALDDQRVGDIRDALEELTDAYRNEMKWTGKTADWLSWAAPFISTLAVHVGGPLLVVGLNAAGFGFVIYTLDVRVDGHGLPARVRSVVQILNEELQAN
ncbi:MAG TPA: hypothetical protein VGL37_07115 [Solirubrobacteraceae bacterium]|jgi:hypothetical protein